MKNIYIIYIVLKFFIFPILEGIDPVNCLSLKSLFIPYIF